MEPRGRRDSFCASVLPKNPALNLYTSQKRAAYVQQNEAALTKEETNQEQWDDYLNFYMEDA